MKERGCVATTSRSSHSCLGRWNATSVCRIGCQSVGETINPNSEVRGARPPRAGRNEPRVSLLGRRGENSMPGLFSAPQGFPRGRGKPRPGRVRSRSDFRVRDKTRAAAGALRTQPRSEVCYCRGSGAGGGGGGAEGVNVGPGILIESPGRSFLKSIPGFAFCNACAETP